MIKSFPGKRKRQKQKPLLPWLDVKIIIIIIIDLGNMAQEDAETGRGMAHLWTMVRGAQIGTLGTRGKF